MRLSQRFPCLQVWRSNLISTIMLCENPSNIWECKCVVQTNSRVKWIYSFCGISEFHCLVTVLFRAMFSCFLLDSFELQEMVCFIKHGATLYSLSILRSTYCTGYDEHACNTIIFSSFMLKAMNEVSWWSRCWRKLYSVNGSGFACYPSPLSESQN